MRSVLGVLVGLTAALALAVVLTGRRPGALAPTYRQEAARALAALPADPPPLVTAADLAPLPAPVRQWLDRAGVVGRPRVRSFRLTFDVQIRGASDDPWMPGTAEQVETFNPAVRLFHMRARKAGLPVEGLHRYIGDAATMDIRLLGLFRVQYLHGTEMTRSETVTLLNDICLLAPAALLDVPAAWEAIDDTSARVRFTNAGHTVEAVLVFDANGDLANFTSGDRSKAVGDTMVRLPFATPVRRIAAFGGTRVVADGDAQYVEDGAPWTYGRFVLTSLAYNVHTTR